jgi:hypothetical protein
MDLARRVVKYPSEGGYSPGDTRVVYVGADGRVQEVVYHRGEPKKRGVVIAPRTDYLFYGPEHTIWVAV